MTMHIAFLSTEYPHTLTGNSGGIGTSIKNLAGALVKAGQQVTVFVCYMNEDIEFDDNGIHVVAIKRRKYKIFSFLFYQRYVSKIISKFNFDIIEVPDFGGITAFMNFRTPCVMKFHGSDTYFCKLESRLQNRVVALVERIAIKRASAYIGVSKFALDYTYKILPVDKQNLSCFIYNGINLESFKYENNFATRTERKVILYYGTLIRKKGVLEIPYIFNYICKKINNVHLVLAGADTCDYIEKRSTWELMKQRFNDTCLKNVSYLGKIPYDDMNKLIRESNVCIFPSYAEAFPVSWLEAMSMGKAIVGSDMEWAKEAIEDKISGYLVYPANHQLYAERILELLQDPLKSKLMGQNARKRVEENFANGIIASKHINFYKSVLDLWKV